MPVLKSPKLRLLLCSICRPSPGTNFVICFDAAEAVDDLPKLRSLILHGTQDRSKEEEIG